MVLDDVYHLGHQQEQNEVNIFADLRSSTSIWRREVSLPKETEPLLQFERRSRSKSTGSEQWEEAPMEEIGMQYLLGKWDDLGLDAY